MKLYQMYENGRILVCQIRATSAIDAACKFFECNPTVNFVSVGVKGSSPKDQFCRSTTDKNWTLRTK